MRHFKMIISRGNNRAPIQTFARDLDGIRREAKAYLSNLSPGHQAVITEEVETRIGTVCSYVGQDGLRMFEENFLDSSKKVEETSKVTESLREDSGKEQTQSGNNT